MISLFKISILCSLIVQVAVAQKISFGPNVGTYIPHKYGINYQDSIYTEILSQASDGERTIGFFMEYKKSKVLSFKGELNFVPDRVTFQATNYVKKCLFCPYFKGTTIGQNAIAFVPTTKVSLFNGNNKFKTSFTGGLSFNFNKRQTQPYRTENNGRDLGVWETINALDETVRSVVVYYNYGVAVQYGRFTLTGRYMKNAGKSIFNDIVVYGKPYKFYAQSKYIFIMLSYNMQGQLKRKKKKMT